MRRRLFGILPVLLCLGLLTVFAYAEEKPIITITALNQSLAYGKTPDQHDCEIVLPDSISNPNWYKVTYTLTADYGNKTINVDDVKIIYDDWLDVTANYQIVTIPGTLLVQKSNLTVGGDMSAKPIEYGQTLEKSLIVGVMGYQKNDGFESVQGEWTWDNPSARPTVSGNSWHAKFTVTDEAMKSYFYSPSVELPVEIRPATPCITISAPTSAVSGQTVDLAVSVINPHDSSLSAPSATITYQIGNSTVMTVQNNRFEIPADTPDGTEIKIIALTPEVAGKYAAATASVTLVVEQLCLDDAVVTLDNDTYSYDGTPKTPGVTVTVGGRMLTAGEDFTVSYADNVEVGEAKVTIFGKGDYSGTVTKSFSIMKAVLIVTAQKQSLAYGHLPDQTYFQLTFPEDMDSRAYGVSCVLTADPAHSAIKVSEVKVTCEQRDVTENFDIICVEGGLEIYRSKPICQTLPTASAIRYGETLAESTITGVMGYRDENGEFVSLKGEWAWDNAALCPESVHDSHRAYFNVTDTELAAYFEQFSIDLQVALVSVFPEIVLEVPETAISGQAISVKVTVSNPLNPDKPGPVPVVTYWIGNGAVQTAVGNRILIPAGTPNGTRVTIKAETAACVGQYGTANATASLTVRQIDLSGAVVALAVDEYDYDGTAKTPAVTVTLDGTQLTANIDYTIDYVNNIYAGTASVLISGIGCYMGETGAAFTIHQGVPHYTAPSALTAAVGQTLAEVELPANWAWAIPGTMLSQIGTILCEAIYTPVDSNYHDVRVSLLVTVKAKAFTVSLSQASFIYAGNAQKPVVTVSADGDVLTEGIDYSLTWPEDCTNAGAKTILVTGQSDYTGTVTVSYLIERADAAAASFTAVLDEADAVYSGLAKQILLRCDEAYAGYGHITMTYRRVGSAEPSALLHAGTYRVFLTMTAGANFNAITTPIEIGAVTIMPRALTVTASVSGKRFGEADPVLTYSAPALLEGDLLSGSLSREDGEQIGTYVIRQGTLANPDYVITFIGANFTIGKASAPAAPMVSGIASCINASYTYTLNAISGGEYRMDNGEWQSVNVFTGISAGSTHIFYARVAGTANAETGEIGSLTVAFDRVSGSAEVRIVGWTYGQPANMPFPVSATNGTSNVTYLYKAADADDSTYSSAIPTAVGSYTVKANFAGTSQYFPVTAIADFTISKRVIPQVHVDLSSPVAGSLLQQTITAGADWTGTITWTPSDICFAYDTVYTATVILTTDGNHRFADISAAEGFTVIFNSDDRLILTKTFAATQKAAGTTTEGCAVVMYDGAAVDVSSLFAIAANADAAAYAIIGGTGDGMLAGSLLTVAKAGTFEIAVSIPAIGQYAAFQATALLTVNRGTAATAIVGQPDADTVIRVDDILTLNVDGADGRTVIWSVTGPAEVADGVVTVTGAGEITVTAAIAENAACEAQTLTYTFIAEDRQATELIRIPTSTLIVEAGEGGRISHSGRNLVVYGSTHTFKVTPDVGYRIADVSVNGVSVGAVETVTVHADAALISVSAAFAAETEHPAAETAGHDRYIDMVESVWTDNLMRGDSDICFSPSAPVTRAMIVTILWRLEGSPVTECSAEFFDVSADQWYAKAICWASANGIFNGYGNCLYGPNACITREQAAAIFCRYAAYRGGKTMAKTDFNDGNWAAEAVEWAECIGLFEGVTHDASDPAAAVDCAELAVYLRILCEGLQ